MYLTKTFMNKLMDRLDNIEERLASDRRAVPVLKETVKQLREDNKHMLDRVMSRDIEQLKTSTAHETFDTRKRQVILDDSFAGEILDLEAMGHEVKS